MMEKKNMRVIGTCFRMLADLGTIASDRESDNERYIHGRIRALLVAEMIENGAENERNGEFVTVQEGFLQVSEKVSNLSGIMGKTLHRRIDIERKNTGMDLVKNAVTPESREILTEDGARIAESVPASAAVDVKLAPETEVKRTVEEIAESVPAAVDVKPAPEAAVKKTVEETAAPPDKKEEDRVEKLEDVITSERHEVTTHAETKDAVRNDETLTDPDETAATADPAEDKKNDSTIFSFDEDDENTEEPGGILSEEAPEESAAPASEENDEADAPETDDSDDIFSGRSDEDEPAVSEQQKSVEDSSAGTDDSTFSFGEDEKAPSGYGPSFEEEFIDIEIDDDPQEAEAMETRYIPKTSVPGKRQSIFRAKSEKTGTLIRDVHELHIPTADGGVDITAYVYPMGDDLKNYLIAITDSAKTVTVVDIGKEGMNEIKAGGVSLGINISAAGIDFESDVRLDVVGSTDTFSAERSDFGIAYVRDFQRTIDGLDYFVVPIDRSNFGRATIPLIGSVSRKGKIFPITPAHSGELRFRAGGESMTVCGAWSGDIFQFEVRHA